MDAFRNVPFLPYFCLDASTTLSDRPALSLTLKCASTSRGERTYALSILASPCDAADNTAWLFVEIQLSSLLADQVCDKSGVRYRALLAEQPKRYHRS